MRISNVLIRIGILETTSCLSVLEFSTNTGADASIYTVEGGSTTSAAALLAIGIADTPTGGELLTLTVANIGGAALVGD